MEQELKQRLIGAVVVTALAAIFIPMLFDDPVDNSGQVVSELIIPEAPIVVEGEDRLPANADQVLNTTEAEPLDAEDTGYPDRPLDEPEIALSELTQEELGYPESLGAEDAQEVVIVEEAEQMLEAPRKESSPPVRQETARHEKPAAIKTPAKESQAATKPEPAVQQKAAPAKSGNGLTRWYIRAGSFSKEENATTRWTELRKQGFPASLETAQVNGKTLYRIKVGPELDQKRAKAMQEKVDRLNKIKSLLVSE
ncbi:MAG: SPOR domain-containing protein [Methylobacter sp.]|uniref:SPOR domain-containing protein n=1 Tax=Methylobacter sp. TaxID=2051955 RepID=UPI00258E4116|nr:SPOR domain-containing protein [Methylobacter sp.]MCL7420522.1 SPOR domain-containing protein [Methylobacter sp.]